MNKAQKLKSLVKERFKHIKGKFPGMRKEVEWTITPVSNTEDHIVTIQSDKRIARIDLKSGKAMLSKSGRTTFVDLNPARGAKEVDVPKDMIKELEKIGPQKGPTRLV